MTRKFMMFAMLGFAFTGVVACDGGDDTDETDAGTETETETETESASE